MVAYMADEQKEDFISGTEDNALLISKFVPLIKAKANRMKNSRIESDDLVSEGFLGLLSAIRSYSPEKGSFEAFANICISNKMKNAVIGSSKKGTIKKAEDFDFSELADDATLTEDLVIIKEQNSKIYGRIQSILSGLEREVFFLYLSSYSYNQISEKLGISVKSVDNAITRAKTKLRDYFKKNTEQ